MPDTITSYPAAILRKGISSEEGRNRGRRDTTGTGEPMSNQTCALTHEGYVDIETAIPLDELNVGDTVLGLQSPDDSAAPRCKHVVTATFGKHRVPTEDPTAAEKFLRFVGLERVYAGDKREGILVAATADDPEDGPALFDIEATPVLDRVIF